MNKRVLLMILLVIMVLPGVVVAQGDSPVPVREVTADEVNAISRELYCPVCENIPLDVCGTAACARWREQVKTLLEEGKSKDEVIDYFVTQFGERVVGTPKDPLLSFLSWGVPAASVVIGLGVVGYVLVRWRRGGPAGASSAKDDDDLESQADADYRRRLERELRDLE